MARVARSLIRLRAGYFYDALPFGNVLGQVTAELLGGRTIAVAPCFAHSERTSGRFTIFVISALRRATIASGVFLGAMRPSR